MILISNFLYNSLFCLLEKPHMNITIRLCMVQLKQDLEKLTESLIITGIRARAEL